MQTSQSRTDQRKGGCPVFDQWLNPAGVEKPQKARPKIIRYRSVQAGSKIYYRKNKMGFPVPLHLWTKSKTGDFIRETLTSKTCRERGIFNPARIGELIDSEKPYGRSLWGLLSLELWFSTFIDQ